MSLLFCDYNSEYSKYFFSIYDSDHITLRPENVLTSAPHSLWNIQTLSVILTGYNYKELPSNTNTCMIPHFTQYNRIGILAILLITAQFVLNGQPLQERYSEYGTLIVKDFKSSMFPHKDRISGHRFQDTLFFHPDTHYTDRSVALFIPKGFKPEKKIDFVVYLHGWYNFLDSVLWRYRLIEQFAASGKNAILIVPQGPRMAPDSHAGKLEEPFGLQNLLHEAITVLKKSKIIKRGKIGDIILTGHSGAFRGIALMLEKSSLRSKIKEVYLFDGLYSRQDKYTNWLARYKGRFVTVYTTDGAAEKSTEAMFQLLHEKRIRFCSTNEFDVTIDDLKRERILFIYAPIPHDEVVYCSDQFMNLLRTSRLKNSVPPRN